ncbi:HERV-H LTR-associating protein 2 isoform X3 [Patagioenas fasciata]|uniref:HERV-H LTR-associating protein 2 isoform X3 n=1 Tax=Patagioenas fasciata TaxID=372321 RepID=UPI003A997823
MKAQKIPSLHICLFQIGATLWGFTEQSTVTGLFSKDCILPCSFPPGDDEVIYWKKGDRDVHSYYYQRDQLESQHPDYRHRTQLFHQNVPSGNASLKLNSLTVADEGSYNCYVGTQQGKTEVEVMLHVKAPHISWVQGNTSIQETDRQETRDGVLYSLRSDRNIINTADPYQCHIHLPHEEWAAEWKMQDQLSNMEGSSTVIPCEYSNNTTNIEGFSVVWTLNRNAVISVLASFNGTSHSYQPRVQINQSDFSLMLHDLTADDSGEYLCNISTPHYTKLTVRTLQVEYSGNTRNIVRGVTGAIATVVVVAGVWVWFKKHRRGGVI